MELRELSINSNDLDSLFNYGKNTFFHNAFTKTSEELNCISDNVITIEGFIFYERSGNDFLVEVRNNNSPIIIKNCIFKSKLNVSGTGSSSIIFDNVIFEANLSSKLNCGSFKISNCQKAFSIDFDASISGDITFSDSIFCFLNVKCAGLHTLNVRDIIVEETFILQGNLRKGANFQHLKCSRFELSNIHSDNIFVLSRDSKIKDLVFNKSSFDRTFTISDSAIDKVNFPDVTFKNTLIIESSKFKNNVYFSYGKNLLNAKISNNSFFNSLTIDGDLSSESTLNISESVFKEISFENFKNTGLLKLSDIRMDKSGVLKSCIQILARQKCTIIISRSQNLNLKKAK